MQALKTAYAPHLGHNVKFGRSRPRARAQKQHLRRFLQQSFPKTPAATNYRAAADPTLRKIYLNDQLGDCVPAWFNHLLGLTTANAGAPFVSTDKQVLADYEHIGGYIPGKPETDQGCDEDTASNYYCDHGFANGDKGTAWIGVDANNRAELEACVYLFEHVTFGVELPDAWVNPFPSSDYFIWNVGGDPVPENGHCFGAVDYDSRGLIIDTWGLYGIVTWAACAKYASQGAGGQLSVMLTPDIIAKAQAKAPNGFDWAGLIMWFDSLGGHVVAPPVTPPAPVPPAPTPTPAPVPGGSSVTLAQAKSWAGSRLPTIMTRAQAERAIGAGLADHWPKS